LAGALAIRSTLGSSMRRTRLTCGGTLTADELQSGCEQSAKIVSAG
jgi:hypothetical protein